MAIGNPITLTSNVASKTISVIATASQTLFTVTGGYRINQLAVFRNGVRLVDGRDFTATDGSTVTLLSAASLSDVLEFQVFDSFNIADAIVSAASTQTISGNLNVTGSLSASTLDTNTGGLTVVGVVTATSFVGSGEGLTGVASTDFIITGTAATFNNTTQLQNVQLVGVTTGLNVSGVATFASNVSIAGTLTYEDVTNVDSVGVITAREGIKVTTGGIDIAAGGLDVAGITTLSSTLSVGSGVTISGTSGITLNEATNASHVINPLLVNYAEKVNTIGNTGSSTTIDVADGTYVTATLDQTSTITLAAPPSGKLYGFALQLTNGSGGAYSITWAAAGGGTIKWPGGSVPTRTTTDAKTDIWSFFTSDGGSNWYGAISLFNFS